MGAYRHDLEAAVSRIDVLEARLAETRAMLEAREAALRTRDAELRALELEMNEMKEPERSGPRLSLGLMTVGAAALLLSLGLSEAFDRADRAEGRYLDARDRLEAERLESERALSALRLETSRLERVVDALDEDDLSIGVDAIDEGEADELAIDEGAADSRIAELMATARDGAADVNDLRLLRALCRKEGREGCYRFSVERLRSERALGF